MGTTLDADGNDTRQCRPRRPDPLAGALAGVAAGLVASFAMNQFQRLYTVLVPLDEQSEPANENAADKVSEMVTGRPVANASKPAAGALVHYGLGAALGLAYGVGAEYVPRITMGGGTGFGVAALLALDEVAVPAAGLAAAPWTYSAGTHAYGLASHLVFGAVAEASRRLLRTLGS